METIVYSRELNERSPDLFSDEDDCETSTDNQHSTADVNVSTQSATSCKDDEMESLLDISIEKTEKWISRHIQSLLSGILPPPSATYVQHDSASLLSMYKRNVQLMDFGIIGENDAKPADSCNNISAPMMPKVLENVEWPQIEKINTYGVHYNRTKYTENIEMMYMKLVERNVGQETCSTFTYSQSTNAKKKPVRKL